MNKTNINAENLPLPSGHRWVDIANEEPNPAARFWWAGEWVTIDDADHDWRPAWSYCIRIEKPLTNLPACLLHA